VWFEPGPFCAWVQHANHSATEPPYHTNVQNFKRYDNLKSTACQSDSELCQDASMQDGRTTRQHNYIKVTAKIVSWKVHGNLVWKWHYTNFVYLSAFNCTFSVSALTLLAGRQERHRACKTEWWGAGVVICLKRGADLHMAQLMQLPLIVSCFSIIQIGFPFLVPAHPGSSGKRAVERVCVCVCETVI